MTPLSALCASLLALAALLVSVPQRWLRTLGQCVAVGGCLLVLAPSFADGLAPLFAQLPPSPLDELTSGRAHSTLPGATRIMLIATALALPPNARASLRRGEGGLLCLTW
jgi:hypothetical protein